MSSTTDTDHGEYGTLGADATDFDRYAAVSLEGGGVIVYDCEYPNAWIQSDTGVDVASIA